MDGSPLPVSLSHCDLEVLLDDRLKFHDHIRSVAHRAIGLGHSFPKLTVCQSPEFMLFLLKTYARPLNECASCVWNTGYKEDLLKLVQVQRIWTRNKDSLQDKT